MGLDFSDCNAHWAYSGFMRFRDRLAKEIGICIYFMEGFWIKGENSMSNVEMTKRLLGAEIVENFYWFPEKPLKWDKIKDDIVPFLYHSDCDGKLTARECKKIAPRLKELVKDWDDNDYDKQQALELIKGMNKCAKNNKPLRFC